MIGYSSSRSCGVPAYCFVSPRKVCLSVPQMPEQVIRISVAPSAGSGRGNSSIPIRPGPVMTAARTPLKALDGLCADRLVERVDVGLCVRRRALEHHSERPLRLVVEEAVRPLLVARVHENLVGLLVEERPTVRQEVLRDPGSLFHRVDERLE